ncbi:hypothetical protein EVAR_10005_1 [Eumeta japonica]|uniref:Uncharacterized protein n=1 Tax=Eumeta variegata TaxID=151549 RepID=A0A4C1TR13_EUMVA|nr:hypothetical protein EVAR_10005_1 [Eumeta japonica]
MTSAFYKENYTYLKKYWACPSCETVTRRKGDNTNAPAVSLHWTSPISRATTPPSYNTDLAASTPVLSSNGSPSLSTSPALRWLFVEQLFELFDSRLSYKLLSSEFEIKRLRETTSQRERAESSKISFDLKRKFTVISSKTNPVLTCALDVEFKIKYMSKRETPQLHPKRQGSSPCLWVDNSG